MTCIHRKLCIVIVTEKKHLFLHGIEILKVHIDMKMLRLKKIFHNTSLHHENDRDGRIFQQVKVADPEIFISGGH